MLDETKRAELEQKYEEIYVIETPKGTAAFKRMDRRQRNVYLSNVSQNKIGEASDFACLATVVFPERAVFETWLDARPGIAVRCMQQLTPFNELAGDVDSKE